MRSKLLLSSLVRMTLLLIFMSLDSLSDLDLPIHRTLAER
jgi:hypothetical protein